MQSKRITRINELLKREIAGVLYRELGGSDIDLAAVTVTRVEIASNLRRARVSVSVLGDAARRDRVLRALQQHRARIQSLISRDIVLKYTPVLSFAHDTSIATGDRVLHLIDELVPGDAPEPPPPAPPAGGGHGAGEDGPEGPARGGDAST